MLSFEYVDGKVLRSLAYHLKCVSVQPARTGFSALDTDRCYEGFDVDVGSSSGLLNMCCCDHFCRGPLGWLVPSEIQPLETRAAGGLAAGQR